MCDVSNLNATYNKGQNRAQQKWQKESPWAQKLGAGMRNATARGRDARETRVGVEQRAQCVSFTACTSHCPAPTQDHEAIETILRPFEIEPYHTGYTSSNQVRVSKPKLNSNSN